MNQQKDEKLPKDEIRLHLERKRRRSAAVQRLPCNHNAKTMTRIRQRLPWSNVVKCYIFSLPSQLG